MRAPMRFICGACRHQWSAVACVNARRLVECPACGVRRGRIAVPEEEDRSDLAIELITQAADLLGWDLMIHHADCDHVDGFVVGTEHYLGLVNASVASVENTKVI